LPDSLKYVKCYRNALTSLPSLPYNLYFIYCDYNSLVSLPLLPNKLRILSCTHNQLTSLPALPLQLTSLVCDSNQISHLPALPNGIHTVSCDYNLLADLPELPDTLGSLFCSYNPNLHCLPVLHKIQHLQFTNVNISCLPNYGDVQQSNPSLVSLPLCNTSNDTYNCLGLNPVSSINEEPSFSLAPNPATSQVTISVNESSALLTVSDITGRQFLEQQLSSLNNLVDIQHLPHGVYLLAVETKGSKVVKRLVKQ